MHPVPIQRLHHRSKYFSWPYSVRMIVDAPDTCHKLTSPKAGHVIATWRNNVPRRNVWRVLDEPQRCTKVSASDFSRSSSPKLHKYSRARWMDIARGVSITEARRTWTNELAVLSSLHARQPPMGKTTLKARQPFRNLFDAYRKLTGPLWISIPRVSIRILMSICAE